MDSYYFYFPHVDCFPGECSRFNRVCILTDRKAINELKSRDVRRQAHGNVLKFDVAGVFCGDFFLLVVQKGITSCKLLPLHSHYSK